MTFYEQLVNFFVYLFEINSPEPVRIKTPVENRHRERA